MSGLQDTLRKVHTKLRQAAPDNHIIGGGSEKRSSRAKFDEAVWGVENEIVDREKYDPADPYNEIEEEPTVIPDEADPALDQARRKAAALRRKSSGRTSTVLTGDTLG